MRCSTSASSSWRTAPRIGAQPRDAWRRLWNRGGRGGSLRPRSPRLPGSRPRGAGGGCHGGDFGAYRGIGGAAAPVRSDIPAASAAWAFDEPAARARMRAVSLRWFLGMAGFGRFSGGFGWFWPRFGRFWPVWAVLAVWTGRAARPFWRFWPVLAGFGRFWPVLAAFGRFLAGVRWSGWFGRFGRVVRRGTAPARVIAGS